MRLSLKFALLIGLGATLIVLLMSILAAKRDVKIIENDMVRDASLIAKVVASAVENSVGQEDWGSLLDSLDLDNAGIRVALIPASEKELDLGLVTSVGQSRVKASIPVSGQRNRVEVTEDLGPRDDFLNRSLRTAGITVISVMLLALGAGSLIGQWLVGRPVERLVAMARGVADEDYSLRIEAKSNDELGDLATELNLMTIQLEGIRIQSRAHAEARLEAELQLFHADRLRMVGQLAAGLAHELGTPLNVISGRAQLLQRTLKKLGEEDDDAKIIHEQSNQIVRIVRQLMDFARPAPHSLQEVDLRRLCQDTIRLLRPTAGDRQLSLEGDEDVLVHGSGEQLQQVVANLIMNAIQATDDDGKIRLSLRGGEETHLKVEDNGTGIEDDIRERVFEPFFSTKEQGAGTGLGLSIVHGIVKDHGGSIRAEVSRLGGACFSLILPRKQES